MRDGDNLLSIARSDSMARKRRALLLVLPLWCINTIARFAARVSERSLTLSDLVLLLFVLLGIAGLFFLLVRSIRSVPRVMIGLFGILAVNVIATFFQVLWTAGGGLIRESPRFLELAYWFPLVTITAYLAFDVRRGPYAIAVFWAVLVPGMVANIVQSPEMDLAAQKLVFMVRFLIANTMFVVLVDLWARVNSHTLSHEDQARVQEQLAHTDDLTGINNRRAITKRVDLEFSRVQQTGGAFSLIVFDIRNFKRINDDFGHPYGDQILAEVAKRGKAVIRSVDSVGRLGGDEFLILLTQTNETAARRIAERLRDVLRGILLPDGSCLDIAVGVASSERLSDSYELISAADRDLYSERPEPEPRG